MWSIMPRITRPPTAHISRGEDYEHHVLLTGTRTSADFVSTPGSGDSRAHNSSHLNTGYICWTQNVGSKDQTQHNKGHLLRSYNLK